MRSQRYNVRFRGDVEIDIGRPTGFAPPIIYVTSHRSSASRMPVGPKNCIRKKQWIVRYSARLSIRSIIGIEQWFR